MNYTFFSDGAGPYPYKDPVADASKLVCVIGTATGDVTLESEEFDVQLNANQTYNPGAMVTLKTPVPDGCYVTIGVGEVKTPDNVRPTGTIKPANPPEEDNPTVTEQGYAIVHLSEDVEADFDTSPGEKTIRVKVNASAFAAKAEYAQYALSAGYADKAALAARSGSADRAVKADEAKKADSANDAKTAESAKTAGYAEKAGYAEGAKKAEEANTASSANTAKTAESAKLAEKACQANISIEAMTAWEAEKLVKGASVDKAVHATSADIADDANRAYISTRSTLADRASFADKAEDAYYSEVANIANYARRDCKGNPIYDTYLRQDEAENIFVSIDEFTNQLEILEDEKADRSELLKTATVGGKLNGSGIVEGTNLALTVTSINGLIEGDDGQLTPISPQDWFQFVNSVAEITDPTLGYALLNQNPSTFPVNSTQFVFSNGLPAELNSYDIYCIYTNDADGEEQKAVGWANAFTPDLDKSKIWNIYDDSTGLQALPEKSFYRVVYDPISGWNVLTCPVTGADQGKFNQLYALVDEINEQINSLKGTDSDVGSAIQEANQKIADNAEKIASLENTANSINQAVIENKTTLSNTQNELTDLASAHGSLSNSVTAIQSNITEIEEAVEDLKQGGAVSDGTMADLQNKVSELQQSLSALNIQNFIVFADSLDPDALTPDLATAVLA